MAAFRQFLYSLKLILKGVFVHPLSWKPVSTSSDESFWFTVTSDGFKCVGTFTGRWKIHSCVIFVQPCLGYQIHKSDCAFAVQRLLWHSQWHLDMD